jgi:DNA invertase Pin-like site-specific DNA recombinase
LQHFGVDFICTDQEIDTKSPAGKLLFTVLGAVSELELDLIRGYGVGMFGTFGTVREVGV